MMSNLLQKGRRILIAAFFISLPVTSFPFFPPSFGGSSAVVRPLLVYPLLGLVLVLTIPRFLSKKLPKPVLILLIFLIWAVVTSILPWFRGLQSPWHEVAWISRGVRTLITLALAFTIYLTVVLIPQKPADLRFVTRWIYAGLVLVIVWSSMQVIYILDLIPGWYEVVNGLQGYISIHRLRPTRISGMTYEPSWFADQIVVIWLPLVLAASLTDYSVFDWRWKWITVEKVLLLGTVSILAFTLSRTGLILGVGLSLFGVLLKIVDGLLFRGPRVDDSDAAGPGQGIAAIVLAHKRLLFSLLGVVVFLAIFIYLGSQSGYISRLWEYWREVGDKELGQYLVYIGFGSRIAYWQTAYNIFLAHPVFGVGLGNFTIYFPDFLPYQHLARTPELLRHIVPQQGRSRVLTAKHFLLRILAEMGIVGLGIFITFLIVLLAGGIALWISRDKEEHFWGHVSILGVVALVIDSFSFDSFAIPNPWITLGMITAAIHLFTCDETSEENAS